MLKMMGLLRKLLPQKIKFRLFFGFVLVILIPLFILQLYYYRQTEDLIVNKISEQFGAQLNIMKTDYNDTVKAIFLHLVQLEKEPAVMEALQAGGNGPSSDNARQIREVLDKMRNRNLSQGRYLYISVADVTGSQYDSFDAPQGEKLPDWNIQAIRELENSSESYRWLSADRNDLPVGLSESAHMLTLTGSLKERGKLVGVVSSKRWSCFSIPIFQLQKIPSEKEWLRSKGRPFFFFVSSIRTRASTYDGFKRFGEMMNVRKAAVFAHFLNRDAFV
jgi:hypothetical protein